MLVERIQEGLEFCIVFRREFAGLFLGPYLSDDLGVFAWTLLEMYFEITSGSCISLKIELESISVFWLLEFFR